MKTIKIVGAFVLIGWVTFSINSCKKDTLEILSTLTTSVVTAITTTTATAGGDVTIDGGAAITERGICFGNTSGPTIANNKVASGVGKGTFTVGLTGLTAATTYFLRAYATNSVGTAYGNEISFTTLAQSIYAVGGRYLGGASVTITYWKNGAVTDIFTGTGNINAYAMAVAGSDVYVAYNDLSSFKIWKNGVASTLPLTKGDVADSYLTGVAVSGNDVYVTGIESGPAWSNVNVAKYWKNGSGINLTNGSFPAVANAITIVGTDVYVAGHEGNGPTYVAKYWKNGVAVNLGDGVNYSEANGLAVVGNDVYVCGLVELAGVLNAVYWKNGTLIKLTNGLKLAVAQKIVVTKDGDIFVAGHENNASNLGVVKLWKNNAATPLSDGLFDAYNTGLCIIGGDVYVAGRRSGGSPQIWKNGVLMPAPFNGTDFNFYLKDIVTEN